MPAGIGKFVAVLLLLVLVVTPGCREDGDTILVSTGSSGTGGTSGGGGSTTPTTGPALAGMSLDAFHLDAEQQSNTACITCHGDMSDRVAMGVRTGGATTQNLAFHAIKHTQIAFQDKCNECHERVDLRFVSQTGGALRKQVDVAECVTCHKAGGIAGKDFYN